MEQIKQQIERFLKKIAQKFPTTEEPTLMTDIHIMVSQFSGDLMAFNDEGVEITRCVVEKWIENTDDDFYEQVTSLLRCELLKHKDIIENFGIIQPFNFVLEDEEGEHIAELYCEDNDTIIADGDLLPGLEEDLDDFLKKLIP